MQTDELKLHSSTLRWLIALWEKATVVA